MRQGRLLVIVDDARVSRLICHVAERFHMSCLAINKTNDIRAALTSSRPDVILLDPEPLTGSRATRNTRKKCVT